MFDFFVIKSMSAERLQLFCWISVIHEFYVVPAKTGELSGDLANVRHMFQISNHNL